jgi:hypothetical protein
VLRNGNGFIMALSNAERQERHRQKLKKQFAELVTARADNGALSQAEARIRALEVDLAVSAGLADRRAAAILELKEQLARQRKPREGTAAKMVTLPPAEAPATTSPQAEAITKAERRIKSLTTQLRHARAELHDVREWGKKTGLPERGGMSLTMYRKLIKALHPDRQPSQAERAEACTVFNVWVDSLKEARDC